MTHIAAIYSIPKVEVIGEISTIFDSEIGMAFSCINRAVERNGFAGAVANTCVATHAVECARFIGLKFHR